MTLYEEQVPIPGEAGSDWTPAAACERWWRTGRRRARGEGVEHTSTRALLLPLCLAGAGL
jgi:hypothetical protein